MAKKAPSPWEEKSVTRDIIFCLLGILSFLAAAAQHFLYSASWITYFNLGTELAFFIEYVYLATKSGNVRAYISKHTTETLCLLPFPAFKLLALYRLRYIVRHSRLKHLPKVRMIASFTKPFRALALHAKEFLDMNGFKYMLVMVTICVLIGTFGIMATEQMNFEDALWWAFVTATTVGYGDLSPSTPYGRLIAMALMIVGIGLIGSVTSTLTNLFINMKPDTVSLQDELILQVKSNLDRLDELSDEEVEELCELIRLLHTHPKSSRTSSI